MRIWLLEGKLSQPSVKYYSLDFSSNFRKFLEIIIIIIVNYFHYNYKKLLQ